MPVGRLRLKCDGTRAETRFRLSAKRTSPFNSAGASVQSTAGSRGVRIGGSNAGYTMFRGSVKSIGYPLHSPVSPSLPLPCVTVCHHISTGLYDLCSKSSVSSSQGRRSVWKLTSLFIRTISGIDVFFSPSVCFVFWWLQAIRWPDSPTMYPLVRIKTCTTLLNSWQQQQQEFLMFHHGYISWRPPSPYSVVPVG